MLTADSGLQNGALGTGKTGSRDPSSLGEGGDRDGEKRVCPCFRVNVTGTWEERDEGQQWN